MQLAETKDGNQICEITARSEMFTEEEVQCVSDIWNQSINLGPEISGYTFYVKKNADRVLGFICIGPRGLTDKVYDLYWIVVDPEFQRAGVGRSLIEQAETHVKKLNGRIIVIETSGKQNYSGTREFYLSCGYFHEATLKDLYADGDDLCIFTKRIS